MTYEKWLNSFEEKFGDDILRAQKIKARSIKKFDEKARKAYAALDEAGGVVKFIETHEIDATRKQMLEFMLKHFELNEEYEKCEEIHKALTLL